MRLRRVRFVRGLFDLMCPLARETLRVHNGATGASQTPADPRSTAAAVRSLRGAVRPRPHLDRLRWEIVCGRLRLWRLREQWYVSNVVRR